MICDKYKAVTKPNTLTTLKRLKGIVAKYEPSDNVFINVGVLSQLLDCVEVLDGIAAFEDFPNAETALEKLK